MRRQTIIVLGVALLLFVAVGASAQLVNPSSDDMLNDHEGRIAALETEVFGNDPTTTTTTPSGNDPTTTTTAPSRNNPTTTTTAPSRNNPTTTTTAPSGNDPTTTTTEPPGTDGVPSTTLPGGTKHLLIDEDTLIENETLVLRPGDSIEFRNGARLSFGMGASADWQGTPVPAWSGLGENPDLDRDIEIFGEGDIRFEHGSGQSVIKFVEVDLQANGEIGRYPLHWHHVGDGSRGTLVQGVVVKNSNLRAFVPHASHGITFRDTIAYNIIGAGYWWDPPGADKSDTSNQTHDTLYDHVLASKIRNNPGDRGFRLSGFNLGAGNNNAVVDSVARDIVPGNVKDCSGFMWPDGLSNRQSSVWVFRNNVTVDSACHGIFVWQNDQRNHVIENFRSIDNGEACISHGAYMNKYDYRDIACDRVVAHALGWSVTGGSIGVVEAVRHSLGPAAITFRNVDVGALVIDNARNPGVAGHYVFENTGLSFDDVQLVSAWPGTTVTIDGETRSYG